MLKVISAVVPSFDAVYSAYSKIGVTLLRRSISGVRINRCFPQLSRREVDALISDGKRIMVNRSPALLGMRLQPGDTLSLDGVIQSWDTYIKEMQTIPTHSRESRHVYFKYWKPVGITCTTQMTDESNIIKSIISSSSWRNIRAKAANSKYDDKLIPIGRLDKDSEGLVLISSDRRLISWLLGAYSGGEKVYEVELDRPPLRRHLHRWTAGVPISTRTTTGKLLSQVKTLPCKVKPLNEQKLREVKDQALSCSKLQFTLTEGRNRQIRRMVSSFGYTVTSLRRVQFCGIDLRGLSAPGDIQPLSSEELSILNKFSSLEQGK